MTETLRIAAFLRRSRANGPGVRSVLWVQGCPFRCAGCFNPNFLPFAGGREAAPAAVAAWMLAETDTEGVSFSGGEPFAQAGALAELAERARGAGKGVLIFTGYEAAALRESCNAACHGCSPPPTCWWRGPIAAICRAGTRCSQARTRNWSSSPSVIAAPTSGRAAASFASAPMAA